MASFFPFCCLNLSEEAEFVHHVSSLKHLYLDRPACDVAISGLGWIMLEPKSKMLSNSESSSEKIAGELHLAIHVPKPVEIFVRPPLPVGKSGPDWYQYQELTEKEEEARPKWYF